MDLGKLSYWSRRIHRISLWGISVLGLVQVLTGLTLKFPSLFPFIDFAWALQIHILNSVYFAAFFLLSMITGLIMYFTPWLLKVTKKNNT